MAEPNTQDKQLPASQRKLEKARADGQVARSRDLGHFAAIAVGGALLVAAAPALGGWLKRLLARGLQFDSSALQHTDFMAARLGELATGLVVVVVPFGLALMAVAVAGGCALSGWTWTFKPLQPRFDGFNPLTGLGRIFSKGQLVNTIKASVLALMLGALGAYILLLCAMYLAMTRESGGAPNRTQTSNESSVNGGGLTDSCSCTSTCGCLRTKREISGATWLRPKPSVALTRSSPFGVALDRPSNSSIPSISPRMRRALSRYSSPSGVRLIRRVVRTTSDTPRRDSIKARCLLTAGVVMPSSRAAALKLPALASVEKKPRSAG